MPESELRFHCGEWGCKLDIEGPYQMVITLMELHQHQHISNFGSMGFYEFVRAVHEDLL